MPFWPKWKYATAPRTPAEEDEALERFNRWRADHPEAGLVYALCARNRDFSNTIDAVILDCDPLILVAIADALLERAGERSRPWATQDPEVLQNIKQIEAARAALDLYPETDS